MTTHEAWTRTQRTVDLAVDDQSLSVAYVEAGADNDGPPVVFLHGIPTWSFLWRRVLDAVAAERHVLAPDLVGYGNSAMHDGFDRSIRAQESMLASLRSYLDAERLSLVGHDIGGSTALRYAAHNPDVVAELVLSNVGCYDSWPVEFVNGLGVPGTVQGWSEAEFDEKMTFLFGEGLYGDPAPEFVEGMAAPWTTREGRQSLERNAVATNTSHTTELDYANITADTLLLWGGDDVLQSTDYADRLHADLSGSVERAYLDDAYHWVVEDRPDAYRARLLAFLDAD